MRTEQTTIAGAQHTVYFAEDGADIAPTCFAMCLKRLRGIGSNIDQLQQKIASPMYTGADPERRAASIPPAKGMAELISSGGLKAQARTVSAFGIAHTFKQAGAHRVFIAQIEWEDGGLHYVVVPGVTRGGQVIALDPQFGGQLCHLCPNYKAHDAHVSRSGKFTGQIIEVTG